MTRRKATEALIHRVGNYPDLLPEIPRLDTKFRQNLYSTYNSISLHSLLFNEYSIRLLFKQTSCFYQIRFASFSQNQQEN